MTLYHSTGIIAASGGAAAKPGMVLLTPTSIAHSGTSASIGANGQVTFTAVTSLSLNGVFSATYDNYVISIRHVNTAGDPGAALRLRASGTDASGSEYARQYLDAGGTSVTAARSTGQTSANIIQTSATLRSGDQLYVYGPFLAQPTAFRNVGGSGSSNAYIFDAAATHSLSTSYDGISIIANSGSLTGALTVMGVRS